MSTLRRAATMAATLAVVPALMGADGGCERPVRDSTRPPHERQADPDNTCTVDIYVTKATGPYTVQVRANEQGSDLGDYSTERAVSPGYHQTLTYTCGQGQRIEVMVTVSGREGDEFGCRIEDGPNVDAAVDYGRVQCYLVTSR